jgi:hypothetical protein
MLLPPCPGPVRAARSPSGDASSPCESAHPLEAAGTILRVKPDNIPLRVSDTRPMRHDFVSLRLASIQHEARAFLAGEQTQSTRAVTVGTIEPSGLAGLQAHTVGTDLDRAADQVGKPVVSRWSSAMRSVQSRPSAWKLVAACPNNGDRCDQQDDRHRRGSPCLTLLGGYVCAVLRTISLHDSAHRRHSDAHWRIISSSRNASQLFAQASQTSAHTSHARRCALESRSMKFAAVRHISTQSKSVVMWVDSTWRPP